MLLIQEVTKPAKKALNPNPRPFGRPVELQEQQNGLEPLSLSEAKSAKENRNDLLNKLIRNRYILIL